MRIAIVGAGLAGLSCATRLVDAGSAVALYDKGRGPGGRLATRRIPTPGGEARFDHGAQYFTARDPGFRSEVEHWARDGIAAPWPAAGADAWVGVPGMSAPAKALAARLDLACSSRIERLERDQGGWRLVGEGIDAAGFDGAGFDAIVVAVPAEQAGALLAPWDPGFAAAAAATPAAPCWTVMAAFPDRLPIAADILKGDGALGWAARDSAKPGRTDLESWVVQAGPAWSRDHLEEAPDDVLPKLLTALGEAAGTPLPEPTAASAHRWRYARSGRLGRAYLWNPALKLGVCGDWLLGPRVECAWVSGHGLAEAMLADRAGTISPSSW